jgi:uncharacterized membrane protein YdjX (TVP38/TMEM64 family)
MTAKSPSAAAPARPAVRTVRPVLRSLLAVVLLITGVVALFYFTELNWRDVPALLQRVSRPLALLIMATMPLIGFPISAVYLAAGAIFGPWLGLLVVSGVTALHLAVMQLLANTVLRGPIERLRHKWHHRIPDVPPHEHATVAAMLVIVPGPPYFVRNCLLAFARLPLRALFGVALPLYVVRSCTTIFLGDLGNDPSRTALAVLVGIYLLKLTATVFLFRRFKHSLDRRKARGASA